jgi:hypothetical protein
MSGKPLQYAVVHGDGQKKNVALNFKNKWNYCTSEG